MGLTIDSDEAKSVKAAFEKGSKSGDFSRMYYHLGKVKSKPKEVVPEPVIDDEAVQVAARKILEKEGKLKTHDGMPSGASGSDEEFIKRFSVGELNSPEDIKRAQEILSKL